MVAVAPILRFPLRLAANGSLATVEQQSDDGAAQEIAVLCMTRPGEHPLDPGFGITDPAFEGINQTDIVAGVTFYGLEVDIVDVAATTDPATDTELATVTFERRPSR